jgi:hypothetical protein
MAGKRGGTKQRAGNSASTTKRAATNDYHSDAEGETQEDLDALIVSYEAQMKKRSYGSCYTKCSAKRRAQEPDFRTLLASRIEESSNDRSKLYARLSQSRHTPDQSISSDFEDAMGRWNTVIEEAGINLF